MGEELYYSEGLHKYGILRTPTPTHFCRGLVIKEEKWTQRAQREKDNKWTRYKPALEVTAVTSTNDTR